MTELHYNHNSSQEEQLVHELCRDIDFTDPELVNQLYFDPRLGALAVRDEVGVRLLVFRGQLPSEQKFVTPNELLNRPHSAAGARNTVFGEGLYVGNSPQSVGVFAAASSPKELAVYLTPAISEDKVLSLARTKDSRAGQVMGFGKEIATFFGRIGSAKKDYRKRFDRLYADKSLILFDMHVGSRGAQWLQVRHSKFPIRPLWYLWRDTSAVFERVGTFNKRPELRSLVRRIATRPGRVVRKNREDP